MILRTALVWCVYLVATMLHISAATAQTKTTLPANAIKYLPLLQQEIDARWPTVPVPAALGAQVEQETCYSLTHSKCWNPRTELKTSREYGFGLGQLTVTGKFDAFAEVKTMDSSLKGWSWENRYDPQLQLRALVVKMRFNFDLTPKTATPVDRQQFATAGYNGGIYGTLGEIKLCKATNGCNPDVWFGQVEKTSKKSKKAVSEYAKSFFDINREYVRNVFVVRIDRYLPHLRAGAV